MVGVEHVGGVEPQLTFSKSESELLKMMRAAKVVTDHFHSEISLLAPKMTATTKTSASFEDPSPPQ